MDSLLNKVAGQELFLVYGLIALVVILIIIIIIIDKMENRKKKKTLFDTINMKIVADQSTITNNEVEELKPVEVITLEQNESTDNYNDIEPISSVEVSDISNTLRDTIKSIEDEPYVESDLEKTQAQIRVEEITYALNESKKGRKLTDTDYTKFEEEQEQNAIISYNELKESYDKLYSENEKIQYIEDDEIPINIDELYQLCDQNDKEDTNKVKLEEFTPFTKSGPLEDSPSNFKSSPLISPVYGIQKPPVDTRKEVDSDINAANQFLQNLRELKNNLD